MYTTAELKTPEFLAINPAGMAPVIEDPNTGIVLAEVYPFFPLDNLLSHIYLFPGLALQILEK